MATYHLYYLRNGELVGSDDIEASDDTSAFRLAKSKGTGQAVEVWNNHRRIRIVAPLHAV